MTNRLLLCTLLALITTIVPLYAHADQCLQPPADVDGLGGGPEWENFDGTGFWRAELHDPRWAGASPRLLLKAPGGTNSPSTPVSTRVLHDGNTVFLAVYGDYDDNGPTFNDEVYIGVSEGNTNSAHALRVRMQCSSFTESAGSSGAPADVHLPRILAAGPLVTHWKTTNSSNPNSWATGPAGTIGSSIRGACWDRVTTGSPRWALTLRLEFSATSNHDRRIFVGVRNTNTSTSTPIVVGNVAPVALGSGVGGQTIIPKAVSNWERFTPAAERNTPCSNGLTLTRGNIGVVKGSGLTNQIQKGNNTFRARITNASRTYQNWEIRARFRISDWGSVDDNAGTWKSVWADGDSFTANPLPNTWKWSSNANSYTIEFNCNAKTGEQYCPNIVATHPRRQDLFVEIKHEVGQETFNSSQHKDMDYQQLSDVTNEATISVKGLKAKPGAQAFDVYLHVTPRNLTVASDKPSPIDMKTIERAESLAGRSLNVVRQLPKRVEGPLSPRDERRLKLLTNFTRKLNALGQADRDAFKELANDNSTLVEGFKTHEVLAMSETQVLDSVNPTYRISPYYVDDSGGNPQLVPMKSFGLYLRHDGPLYGFKHFPLTSTLDENKDGKPDTPVEPVPNEPNWYRMSIPVDSAAIVNVRLASVDEPVVTPPTGTTPTGPTSAPLASSSAPTSTGDQTAPPTSGSGQPPPTRGCDRCAVQTSRFGYWPTTAALLGFAALRYRRARRRKSPDVN